MRAVKRTWAIYFTNVGLRLFPTSSFIYIDAVSLFPIQSWLLPAGSSASSNLQSLNKICFTSLKSQVLKYHNILSYTRIERLHKKNFRYFPDYIIYSMGKSRGWAAFWISESLLHLFFCLHALCFSLCDEFKSKYTIVFHLHMIIYLP